MDCTNFTAEVQVFISTYANNFRLLGESYLNRFSTHLGDIVTKEFLNTTGIIYIFGNGGSHAIGRIFRHALRERGERTGYRKRVLLGVDPDTYSTTTKCLGPDFVAELSRDGADSSDCIFLISGSGDSDNLVAVVAYAIEHSISVYALVGKDDCNLKNVLPLDNFFPVGTPDQQVCEDVIQYVCCLIADERLDSNSRIGHIGIQADAINQLPASFIINVAKSVDQSFADGGKVRVIGLGHPALAVCAEHTAHNLNWDAFYLVDTEPNVTIVSTPSACDYSGISNDRSHNYIQHFAKTYALDHSASTTLIFSHDSDESFLTDLCMGKQSTLTTSFLLSSKSEFSAISPDYLHHCQVSDVFVLAGVAQCSGHMIGRVLRLLLQARHQCLYSLGRELGDVSNYLINRDLAQRRLLDNT